MLMGLVLLLSPIVTCDVTPPSPVADIASIADWDHGREDEFFYSVIDIGGASNMTCDSGKSKTFDRTLQLYCTFSNAILDGTRSFHCDNMNTLFDERIELGGQVAADGSLVFDDAKPIPGANGSTVTYRAHQISLYDARVELGPDGQPRLALGHVKVFERDEPILDWNRRLVDRCTTLFSTWQEKDAPLENRR
jgi:hypothetical protein